MSLALRKAGGKVHGKSLQRQLAPGHCECPQRGCVAETSGDRAEGGEFQNYTKCVYLKE